MKKINLSLVLILMTSCSSIKLSKIISTSFDAPESVAVDEAAKLIYVSNVSGDGLKYDSNGFISKLDIDGNMIEARWSKSNLNGPKGMRAHNGILYVADIKDIVLVDMKTGSITSKVRIKSAIVLNDITIDPLNNTLYVSDTMGEAIYKMNLKSKKVSTFISGSSSEAPNGLYYFDGKLMVGGWGSGIKKNWSTTKPGSLYLLDLKTKKKTVLIANKGQLDGIEQDPNNPNLFYITDWVAGKLFVYNMKLGEISLIKEEIPGAADLGILSENGKTFLFIPSMKENEIIKLNIDG